MNDTQFLQIFFNIFLIGLGLFIVKFYIEKILQDTKEYIKEKLQEMFIHLNKVEANLKNLEERIRCLEKNHIKISTYLKKEEEE